jgi:hypothetical protein
MCEDIFCGQEKPQADVERRDGVASIRGLV